MPRITTTEEVDRMADRIINESSVSVQDRDSFDLAYRNIVEMNDDELSSRQRSFRKRVFDHVRGRNPDIRSDRLFRKAGGRDLKKDRERTGAVVYSDEQYIKRGARNVDFAGYDIRERDIPKKAHFRKEFTIPALQKIRRTGETRQVFVKRESVVIRGVPKQVFRDSKGRFAAKK